MPSLTDPNCQRCSLHRGVRTVCVPGTGPTNAKIMLVGEAPGANEDRDAKPFVGRAGKFLDDCLAQAGLSRDEVYITNVVRCRPPDNRAPTDQEKAACRIYTVRQIEEIEPKVIVALGGSAGKELARIRSIAEVRGRLLSLAADYRSNAKVIVTYHPAAVLHNPSQAQRYGRNIVEDLKLAARYTAPPEQEIAPVIIGPSEKAKRALTLLRASEDIACDAEWTTYGGMYPWSRDGGKKGRLLSVAVAGEIKGKLVAVAVPVGQGMDEELAEFLNDRPMYYHSAVGDLTWMRSYGFRPGIKGDTLVLASLLNIDSSHSIKALAPMFTDMPVGWEAEASDLLGVEPASEAEWQRLLHYEGLDAIAEFKLHMHLHGKLNQQAARLYSGAIIPAVNILADAALLGAEMDMESLDAAKGKSRRKLFRLIQEIATDLDLGERAEKIILNKEALARVLQQKAKIELPRTAVKGDPSTRMMGLIENKNAHPAIPKIIELRKMEKLYGTYLKPWSDMIHRQDDNRLHTIYKLNVARSGRSSAASDHGGHLQQFPRGAMRRLIKAPPGRVLMAADESQIELRIAAWLANDQTMIQYFNEGVDIHRATAAFFKAFFQGLTLEEFKARRPEFEAMVTKDERQAGKPANFGLLYGGQEDTLIGTALKDYNVVLSREQATRMITAHFVHYAQLRPWHESCKPYVDQGYCDTPFGRRRILFISEKENYEGIWRKAINTPVQAIASDISLRAMAEFVSELGFYDLRHTTDVIGFVHDQVLAEVDEDAVPQVAPILKKAMEDPGLEMMGVDLTVPLEAEVLVGRNWHEMQPVEKYLESRELALTF